MSNLGNKQIMAKNIQYYMDINGKTRNDMCEALGVKYTTFTDWVKGNSYPRIDKIELMANYFGIEKSDLIEGGDTMSDEKEKKIFSSNLNRYMKKTGKTQSDIITDLGINKSTISTWCNGTKMPRMGTIQKLADYFGIKKSDLVEEKSYLPEGAVPYIPSPTVKVPLVGVVNCGTPLFAEDNIEDYISTPKNELQSGEVYFWLRAKGDSMINVGIRDGDPW